MSETKWQIVGATIAFVAIITPIFVAYDLWQRGSAPEHELVVEEVARSSPVEFLSDLDGVFSLQANGVQLKEFKIVNFLIYNSGPSSILPEDYFEPLGLTISSG